MRRSFRPTVTTLEGRDTPAAFSVTSLLDDGSAGTLRAAVNAANANGEDDTITFAVDGIVHVGSPLALTEAGHAVTIDGNGHTDPVGLPVAVNGDNATQILTVAAGVTATVHAVTLEEGKGDNGGAVVNSGDLTLTNGDVLFSIATERGGGILNDTGGTLTVTAVAFNGNAALLGGAVRNRGTMTATDCGFDSNAAVGSIDGFAFDGVPLGGGIVNTGDLTIIGGSIRRNMSASYGGGIYNNQAGRVTLDGVVVAGNTALLEGGGVYNEPGDLADALTIRGSTFQSNTAGFGGAVRTVADVTITNSTFARNEALGLPDNTDEAAGAVYSESTHITIDGCTFAENTNLAAGGGATDVLIKTSSDDFPNELTISNTILGSGGPLPTLLSSNKGGTAAAPPRVTSAGYNLSRDANVFLTGPGDVTGVDPRLAPLAYYGGRTLPFAGGGVPTYAVLPGSPAIDAGDPAAAGTDQRGLARVGRRDIGAFESQGFALTATSGDKQSAAAGVPFAQPLVATVTAKNAAEPVDGGVVTFAGPGLAASGSAVVPIVNGQATYAAAAGAVVGDSTVTAAATGAAPATFAIATTARPNTPPALTTVADQTLPVGSSGTFAFGVFDAETPAVTVTATSPNPAVTVGVSGSGVSRTVTVVTAAGAGGTATVTLTATDGDGATATDTFVVTVPPPAVSPALPARTAAGLSNGLLKILGPDGVVVTTLTPFAGFVGDVRTAVTTGAAVVAGTGPGRATSVKLLDADTGVTAFEVAPFEAAFTGGVFVAAGDLFGTGTPDVIVTPDQGGGPRVQIRDGKTGAVKADFFGIADTNFRGGARAAVGDVTGDGVPDLIVAAGAGGGPRVTVWDGASIRAGTPRAVADFFTFEPGLRDGVYVAAGDVDGDGRADLVLGAGPGGGPRVTVLSGSDVAAGRTPTVLSNFFAGDAADRAGVRVAVKSLDGDAKADVVTGAGSRGQVRGYAAASLAAESTTPLFTFDDDTTAAKGVYVG